MVAYAVRNLEPSCEGYVADDISYFDCSATGAIDLVDEVISW